jgi:hypothetical protein
MTDKYILVGQTPVPCHSTLQWAAWFEEADCQVALTKVGKLLISTVFLGLNHNFIGAGDPLLFETIIFDAEGTGGYPRRFVTWLEAEQGHRKAVEALREVYPEAVVEEQPVAE